jgi:hypothetical protein
MKLNELEIDHGRTGAVRHRDSVAGRDLRIRGFVINLARPPSCEQDRSRKRRGQVAVARQEPRADTATIVDDEINNARVIFGSDLWQSRRAFPEDAADLAARCIVCMQYAPCTMCRFHCEREFPIGRSVELDAPGNQFTHEPWTILDKDLDGVRIAQAVASGDGIRSMQLRGIARSNRRRNASLRVAGVAVSGSAFGEDENVALPGDFGNRA